MFAVWTYAWVSAATVVDGQVVEVTRRVIDGQRSYAPRVTYELDDQLHEFIPLIASGSPDFKVGEHVKVAVSQDLEREAIGSFMQLYGLPSILFFVGLIFAAEIAVFQVGEKLFYLLHPQLK